MRIRAATPADLPLLQDIERAAGAPFRTLGMTEIADDEPPALELLERFRNAGHAWVAEGDGAEGEEAEGGGDAGRPVAYLVGEPVDGAFHIEQVSVHPDAAHRGVGRTLIAYAADHARDQGLTGLTLTTFTEVPWNAPYYERIGFRALTEPELTPGLRKIRATEAEHGLDRWPRVCMYRAMA
ncbi:GNAT family N-acetyltransferase [Streptomyces sp. NPDC050597]|jgi:GNAT superfamily N-acetyltransferase|uniref:GNAT family N-acetyltransferase n=1 Tax=Streptomyces sp. NPDC050597 TaxID=3157212 RepID=UPI003431E69B